MCQVAAFSVNNWWHYLQIIGVMFYIKLEGYILQLLLVKTVPPPPSLGALEDGRFGHLPSSRATGSRLNWPSSLALGAPVRRQNHVLYSPQRGGSLRRMDLNSPQRGGLKRFSPLPGFEVFFGPQETSGGDTLCLLSSFA